VADFTISTSFNFGEARFQKNRSAKMNSELIAVLEQLERDKGIPKEKLFTLVENAILASTIKAQGPVNKLRVSIDRKTGLIKAFATLKVVAQVKNPNEEISYNEARKRRPGSALNGIYEFEVTPNDMGRIAAQAVKQGIMQALRDEERRSIYDEFKGRAGDIITGTVRRFVKSDVIVDLGKYEAIMPEEHRVPTEEYNIGDRIRALIHSVTLTPRGPEIILTRSHINFVRRLFELECSELTNGTIEIMLMAREPGYRTKIAVGSKLEKVDPVGACVGIRGTRVKNIVRELNNERVDIFKYSDDIRELTIEALKPAKLKSLEFDEKNKRITVIVDDENLSLAIGKRGQNARLTQKLIGWEIDIRRDETVQQAFQEKLAEASSQLAAELGISPKTAAAAVSAGFANAEMLREADIEDIESAIPDEAAVEELLAILAPHKLQNPPAPTGEPLPTAAHPEETPATHAPQQTTAAPQPTTT
jgi:N utilization substance protein A